MVYFEGKQPITLPALIIGNIPREIRGISLKGGRTGTDSCQIQNPFDRQTYRAESFYSFHPWLRTIEKPLFPNPPEFQIKKNIYKYFVTKNFPFTRQHALDALSSASWQSISQLPSFPAIFEDVLPSRLSHHRERTTPEIRQRTVFVCQSRCDFPFASRNVYFTICFIHLWCSSNIKRNFFVQSH